MTMMMILHQRFSRTKTITCLSVVLHVVPRSIAKLSDENVNGEPESTEVGELVLVQPDFLREQETDQSNSKHIRTCNIYI